MSEPVIAAHRRFTIHGISSIKIGNARNSTWLVLRHELNLGSHKRKYCSFTTGLPRSLVISQASQNSLPTWVEPFLDHELEIPGNPLACANLDWFVTFVQRVFCGVKRLLLVLIGIVPVVIGSLRWISTMIQTEYSVNVCYIWSSVSPLLRATKNIKYRNKKKGHLKIFFLHPPEERYLFPGVSPSLPLSHTHFDPCS